MSTHGDGGAACGRRKEDSQAVRDGWIAYLVKEKL